MRNILTFLLTIITLTSCAQKQEVKFESMIKPNRVYIMTFKTSSKSIVDFNGPKEKIERIKEKGITFPVITENKSEMVTTIYSDSLEKDQSFHATMKYGEIKSIDINNGAETESGSPISGLIIKGVYNSENKFKIDTFISEKIDANLKNTLKASIENAQDQINFPDKPMKIGDDFNQKMPMSIPIAGLNPIKVVINTNYKLIKIKDNIASFDLKRTIKLEVENQQFEVEASGGGKGISEFDIMNMYLTKEESDLDILLKINIKDMIVKTEIKSTTSQNVKIEKYKCLLVTPG
jgi:hypothetical protein